VGSAPRLSGTHFFCYSLSEVPVKVAVASLCVIHLCAVAAKVVGGPCDCLRHWEISERSRMHARNLLGSKAVEILLEIAGGLIKPREHRAPSGESLFLFAPFCVERLHVACIKFFTLEPAHHAIEGIGAVGHLLDRSSCGWRW